MGANKKINPNKLPWFPFYTAAWLGSDTVQSMTYTERGIYHELLAMCWQYGSIPWDKSKLSKKLRIDPRVCGRFMDKYRNLTGELQDISSKVPQTLHRPYMDVTFPQLQDFAETLAKNVPAGKQSRGEKSRGDLDADEQAQPALTLAPTNPSLPPVTEEKTKTPALVDPSKEPVDSPTHPTPATPVKGLGNIREWKEDRFGVSGQRLAHCIIFQLDYSKDDWYRDSGITVASMEKENFVAKLNAETPLGWTPESHGKRIKPTAPNKAETDEERETREYRERIARLKKEGKK